MRPLVYYCDRHEIPLPPGHKFPMRKYRMLRDRLSAADTFDLREAPLATFEEVVRVHDPAYVQAFRDGSLAPAAIRRIGFPWSEGLVRRTFASAGSTLAASRHALEHGWSGGLAGGTHHAFLAEGSGFCILNDIAIAIETLRAEKRIHRAAVVDLDVHQGDGTAAIFESDPDVLTISLHGRNNFPFRKQRSTIDIEFDDGTGDDEYVATLQTVLPHVTDFHPQIVFFQAGVDALHSDRLGKLALSHAGLETRDRMMAALPYPLVATLGGGYAEPIEDTVDAHATTFLTMAAMRG